MDCIHCNSAVDGGCISWRLYPNDFTDKPIATLAGRRWCIVCGRHICG